VKSLFAEVAGVIGAASRPLAEPFKAQVLALLTDSGSTQTPSMYRDMKAGYPIEADQIIGDLQRRAVERGIATPLLSAVFTRLKVYEQERRR
jgi:2-dehydropantoate 2-reductase